MIKEYSAKACICDGELKCACAKEICKTCEVREAFNCQDAKIIMTKEEIGRVETKDIREAIETLKFRAKFYSCGPGDCPCKYKNLCDEDKEKQEERLCKARQTAIEVLEKQIPNVEKENKRLKNLVEEKTDEINQIKGFKEIQ